MLLRTTVGMVLCVGMATAGTVVSFDFTTMNSAPNNVDQNGGEWSDKGWTVGGGGDQLRVDLGRDLDAGKAEIVVTVNSNPATIGEKINYFCVSELAANSHGSDGSKAYLRTGQEKYGFSKFKAYWKGFDHGEYERGFGSSGHWVKDGTTEHMISISWDENAWIKARGPTGEREETLREEFGPIRYVFLGSYNYGNVVPTMTFKSLTVWSDVVDASRAAGGTRRATASNRVSATLRCGPDNGIVVRSPEASRLTIMDVRGRAAFAVTVRANEYTELHPALPRGAYVLRLLSGMTGAVVQSRRIVR